MDENRYNTRVRHAMSERLKKCSKDKYEKEQRVIEICDIIAYKRNELSYVEYTKLVDERNTLSREIDRLRIEYDVWDSARELCMDIADTMCRED